MKSVFVGWVDHATGKPVAASQDGVNYKAHEGDKIKKLLGIKRLQPQFNRA